MFKFRQLRSTILLILALGTARTIPVLAGSGLSDIDKAELANLGQCVEGMYHDPAYAPLQKKLPNDATGPSDTQLNDPTRVTDEEAHAIFVSHPVQSACENAAIEVIARDNPRLAEQLAIYEGVSSFALHQLAFRKVTWGEFNQRRMRSAFIAARNVSTPPTAPTESDDEIRQQLAGYMTFNRGIDSQFEDPEIHSEPPGTIR